MFAVVIIAAVVLGAAVTTFIVATVRSTNDTIRTIEARWAADDAAAR